MSKYTTEVRYICEVNASLGESEGYNSVDTIIAESRGKIFDFDYPIFDENYKPTLETKILRHYYTREIGLETVGLWKHFLNMRMNEIMPYYNKLYESELIEFNPLYDVDYTKEGTHSDNEDRTDNDSRTDTMTGSVADVGTSSDAMTGTVGDVGASSSTDGGSDSTSGSDVPKRSTWDLYSDTPQGGIAGIQGAEDDPSLGSNAYLTNARHIIEDGTGSTSSSTTNYGKTNQGTNNNTRTYNTNNAGTNNNTRTYNTENESEGSRAGNTAREGEYFERIRGKMPGKSYAKMLQELRETFLNIDMMIIEDLSDLFLNIY